MHDIWAGGSPGEFTRLSHAATGRLKPTGRSESVMVKTGQPSALRRKNDHALRLEVFIENGLPFEQTATWGMIVFGLGYLIVGTVVMRRRTLNRALADGTRAEHRSDIPS